MGLELEQYKLIVENTPNLIWVSGVDGKCYYFNQTWLDFRGRSLGEEYYKAVENNNSLSVIMFDVDEFKLINDNYGHLIGDQVLKAICDSVNQVIRDFDLFARYGGDEFIIGLPATDTTAANKVAVRINNKINQIEIADEEALKISCSIGTVTLNNEKRIEDLIDKADKALYICKNDGGNCVVSYHRQFAQKL